MDSVPCRTASPACNSTAQTVIGGPAGATPGACTGACNVISGNASNGVNVGIHFENPPTPNDAMGTVYSSAAGTSVAGNFIGVNAAGTARLPNGPANPPLPAPQAFSTGISVGAPNVIIGGRRRAPGT